MKKNVQLKKNKMLINSNSNSYSNSNSNSNKQAKGDDKCTKA